jgi:hypothetical protein
MGKVVDEPAGGGLTARAVVPDGAPAGALTTDQWVSTALLAKSVPTPSTPVLNRPVSGFEAAFERGAPTLKAASVAAMVRNRKNRM